MHFMPNGDGLFWILPINIDVYYYMIIQTWKKRLSGAFWKFGIAKKEEPYFRNGPVYIYWNFFCWNWVDTCMFNLGGVVKDFKDLDMPIHCHFTKGINTSRDTIYTPFTPPPIDHVTQYISLFTPPIYI